MDKNGLPLEERFELNQRGPVGVARTSEIRGGSLGLNVSKRLLCRKEKTRQDGYFKVLPGKNWEEKKTKLSKIGRIFKDPGQDPPKPEPQEGKGGG